MMSRFLNSGRYKQKGYTLIELLLVIIVISLIASLGVKIYRDKAESDRINIASLNIQHILEAGMSYNVAHNGMWPLINWQSSSAGCPSAPQDTDFVKNYLPNESNQSNYGSSLCWDGDDATAGAQKSKRFWVALQVGSDENSVHLAQRIAARLPNAIITNDPSVESSAPGSGVSNNCNSGQPCYVKAEVTVPSASNVVPPDSDRIVAVGLCDPSKGQNSIKGSGANATCQRTTLQDQFPSQAGGTTYANDDSLSEYHIEFDCKSTEKGKIYVTPNFLRVDRDSKSSSGPFYDLTIDSAVCYNRSHNGKQTCTLDLNAESGGEANGKGQNPPTPVGCKQAYVPLGICSCNDNPSKTCGDTPGAIGATYIAVCSPLINQTQNFSGSLKNQTW
jgi:prepilin-type N-terminal cleavage/methylation domain-containing protein